ncbi:actin-like isoform X2 [Xenia sp. Carnegie-2017]|uniref:actin-like isoform X2 n=1 Tax=Xenia sp. Carnegie-2017 TaxID=2897299 RepID=UPI001F0353A4|nr:actin-like isoform X2 [Xenia sp. Carnegie-2017]
MTEHALIIDNGSDTLKAGFSCFDEPQVFIPSLVGRPHTNSRQHIKFSSDSMEQYRVGHEAHVNRQFLTTSCPIENGIINNWDDMEKLWQYTFDQLDTTPKEKAVLLTDIPSNSKQNREKIAEIMFEKFHCSSIYLANQGALSLYSHGLVTGVAVDCGHDVTQIASVVEGYTLPYATRCLPLGGKDLTMYLLKMLTQNNTMSEKMQSIDDARMIKEKLCYVTECFEREKTMFKNNCTKNESENFQNAELFGVTTENRRLSLYGFHLKENL